MADEQKNVYVGETQTTMNVMDGDSLLSPKVMDRIVRAVLQAVNEQQAHGMRVKAETRVRDGSCGCGDGEG